MVIQVRSEPLSQECDVKVDPSAEASLPTKMLVQESNSGAATPVRGVLSGTETPEKMNKVSMAAARPPTMNPRVPVRCLILTLLVSFPFFLFSACSALFLLIARDQAAVKSLPKLPIGFFLPNR
jgi:hypothetical protein